MACLNVEPLPVHAEFGTGCIGISEDSEFGLGASLWTGDLDRASAEEILDLLSSLVADHGKTILMVTHDPLAAERADFTLTFRGLSELPTDSSSEDAAVRTLFAGAPPSCASNR